MTTVSTTRLGSQRGDDNQQNGGENNEAPRPTYLTKADQQGKKKQKSKAGWKVFYPRKEVGSHC